MPDSTITAAGTGTVIAIATGTFVCTAKHKRDSVDSGAAVRAVVGVANVFKITGTEIDAAGATITATIDAYVGAAICTAIGVTNIVAVDLSIGTATDIAIAVANGVSGV